MRAETLGAFERHLVAAAARPLTIATYLRVARAFLKFLHDRDLTDVTRRDVEAFLARRTDVTPATATRNRELGALRSFFRSQGDADPTADLALKRPDHRQPDVPTTTELGALFVHASHGPAAERSLAILVLLFQAGLRVHELVGLDVGQVDLDAAVLLAVAGKSGTRFDVPLGPEAVALVRAWIAKHPTGDGALFPSRGSAAAASVRSIQRLLARVREGAGLAKRITPHSLRHATATQAIARGVSLPDTAALMRHARVETTMGYVALASNARQEAATRIGAAIPRAVLPPPRVPSEIRAENGAHDAVDVDDDLCDASRPETDGPTSQKTETILNAPTRARSSMARSPRREPPLAEGGSRGQGRLEELLAVHLAAVAELVDARLSVHEDRVRARPLGRHPGLRRLRPRRHPHVDLEPDHPRDG